MLGRLLEFGVCVRPVAEAIGAFEELGLRSVPTSDIAPDMYAAVTDGRITIGLHETELDGLTPTFVRQDLKEHVPALERLGVEFELRELADEQFHRAGFRDPAGLPVLLIEARTFPPPEACPDTVKVCGDFAELSVATHSLEESLAFWTALGFSSAAGAGAICPSARLEGYGLALGLYETARFGSALTFRADHVDARGEYLRAKGFELRRGCPVADRHAGSFTLDVADGIRFFIVGADSEAGAV